jgi:hypothetical protein
MNVTPSTSLASQHAGVINPLHESQGLTKETSLARKIQLSKQNVFSIVLLGLSIFLFGALTFWHTLPIFGALDGFFLTLFGGGAYLFILGLIAFAIVHLIEETRKIRFIRWSLVLGLLLLFLLILAESRLILGSPTGGVIGSLMVRPLLGWPPIVQHILVIGFFIIVAVMTLRAAFRH